MPPRATAIYAKSNKQIPPESLSIDEFRLYSSGPLAEISAAREGTCGPVHVHLCKDGL